MFEKDKWMSIGEIVAPQGLKGDIRIKPSSDFPERFTQPGKRWLQKANELPTEIDKQHDNPKRFFCTVYIKNQSIAEGWGKSMKQAEKEAASKALYSLENKTIDIQLTSFGKVIN